MEFEKKTFCILPWVHLDLNPNGTLKICCKAQSALQGDNGAASLYRYSIAEIWNSADMCRIRKAMLAGEVLKECIVCYNEEKTIGSSYRTRQNTEWLSSFPILSSVVERSAVRGGQVSELPMYYQINPGNLCNLKCRMCSSTFSSQIERDPVHRQWAPPRLTYADRNLTWVDESLTLALTAGGISCTGFEMTPAGWRFNNIASLEICLPEGVTPLALSFSSVDSVQVSINNKPLFSGLGSGEQIALTDSVGRTITLGFSSNGQATIADLKLYRTKPKRATIDTGAVVGSRFTTDLPWHKQEGFLFEELVTDNVRKLYFTGGEPLLIDGVLRIIDDVIQRGIAGDVILKFNTNATKVSDEFLTKARLFKRVEISLSIDGYGACHEYMRYPSRWKAVDTGIQRLATLPNVLLFAVPIIQTYNVLYVADLFAYLESLNIGCGIHILSVPPYLSIWRLPPNVLNEATRRITQYLEEKSPKISKSAALSFIRQLETGRSAYTEGSLSELMLFTNDLDRSRKQSIVETFPDLLALLHEAGITWSNAARFDLSR